MGLLPPASNGYASWSTAGAGVIPNRTTIYRTLAPSGGDDTAAIQTALNGCPANQVVLLTAGVFNISGNGIDFTTPNCTLRGAGPGRQLSTGLNKVDGGGTTRACASGTLRTIGDGSFCIDATATQLVKTDRVANPNYEILYVGPSSNDFGTTVNLTADAVQGAYAVTVASIPSGLTAGSMVLIDENTDSDPNVVWGPSFGGPGDGSRRWFSRQDRSLSQIMEVTAVNASAKTVTFSTPFHYPYHISGTGCSGCAAQMTTYVSFLRGAGVENLFLFGGMGGDGHGNLPMAQCAYCWVKNVEAMWHVGTSIGFYSTFRSTLRDSYMHETPSPSPGGGGYLSGINTGAADNLFENNIMWQGNKVNVMRGSGGGNVLGYNYTDDSFGDSYPDSPEAGVNAGHYTTPHLELLEGNYSDNFKGDTYWGNSIYITLFRNWLSGLRAAHPPLNTYSAHTDCTHPYGDYSGRTAVDVQAYSFSQNFIGNVLGMNGQVLLSSPTGCDVGPQQGFVTQVTTTAQHNASDGANDVVMWQFGTYQATVNSTGDWSFIDSTINTQLRTANWDWVTKAEHCYGTGGTTDLGCSGVVVPPSFYLAGAPAFFQGHQWPWVDPVTGTTYTLPAKYCFEHGAMPTCAIP